MKQIEAVVRAESVEMGSDLLEPSERKDRRLLVLSARSTDRALECVYPKHHPEDAEDPCSGGGPTIVCGVTERLVCIN